MRVILTESQIHQIIKEERIHLINDMRDSLNESITLQSMKKKIKMWLLAGVAIGGIIAAIDSSDAPDAEKNILKKMVQNEMVEDSTYIKRVNDVKSYMETALKNQGYSLQSTQLKPETLVKMADKHNFDIYMLMAAAHLESCFGATPRAKRTGSIYSVGCYDNGKNVVTYSDPNDSVESYINLINNDYLSKDKSLPDLLSPGGFVNFRGSRYASDKKYESKLKSIINRIKRTYPDLAKNSTTQKENEDV